jgi:hypothetical protein
MHIKGVLTLVILIVSTPLRGVVATIDRPATMPLLSGTPQKVLATEIIVGDG